MKDVLWRGPVTKGINEAGTVDREKGVIYGYSVVEKGMARGHGEEIDDVTLDQVVEAATESKVGLKSRFGHPDMSSDALGTFIGRAKNFRRVGDKVIADLHIDATAFKTPNGDLGTYIMDLAESDPAAFGSSLVLKRSLEYRLNDDGTKKKDKNGKDLPPLVRVKKVLASDFVDSPAASTAAFSGTNVLLSAEASQVLDDFLSRPDAEDRIQSFLDRYLENRTERKEVMSDTTEATQKPSEGEQDDVVSLWRRLGTMLGRKPGSVALTEDENPNQRDAALDVDREALRRDRAAFAVERDLSSHRETIEPAQLAAIEPIMLSLKTAELSGDVDAGKQYASLAALLPSLKSDKAGGELANSDDGALTAGDSTSTSGTRAKLSEERRAELAAKYPGMKSGTIQVLS